MQALAFTKNQHTSRYFLRKPIDEYTFRKWLEEKQLSPVVYGKNYGMFPEEKRTRRLPSPVVGYRLSCPSCQTKNTRRLIATLNEKNELLLHCYAGCGYEQVTHAIFKNDNK